MEQGITPYGVISRLSEQGNKNLLPYLYNFNPNLLFWRYSSLT